MDKANIVRLENEEKIRAAYALNMCMVSVSQIIDYNDINILEQEYEGILNNLNLEMIPKDEALLTVLKRLLDTITFFRIHEVDKEFVDREYQQKMKNAIWNAVPNFGLIVAGGNPVSMAISLASQVGIGYMNYRRAKSENSLEHDKQRWQLQRSAIEQFNGLRRELFDTAWRLADKYEFPDEYRLTERQIKQFNNILMDGDEIRKYERLSSIKESFTAYPPFWYYFGNTANHIARNDRLQLTETARKYYSSEAKSYFEKFWETNRFSLLREDHLACSCALELIDLLDTNEDKEKINELLEKAVKFSGNSNDILQLCAIAYLRIGNEKKAARLFRILTNENYNAVVNAQLLSGIYVREAVTNKDRSARAEYETLSDRVNSEYLLRLPGENDNVNIEELEKDFIGKQRELLQRKYNTVTVYCVNDLGVRLGKLIPVPDESKSYGDYYFSADGLEKRIADFRDLFSSEYKKSKRLEYLQRLSDCDFINKYFDEVNNIFDTISHLNCIRDIQELRNTVEHTIQYNKKSVNSLIKRIEERQVNFEDMCKLLKITSTVFFAEFVNELNEQISLYVNDLSTMLQISEADSALKSFCDEFNIPQPEEIEDDVSDVIFESGSKTPFSLALLGDEGLRQQNEQRMAKKIEEIIRNHEKELKEISERANIFYHNTKDFESYFQRSRLSKNNDIRQKAIVIYDDTSKKNTDIILTSEGIIPIVRNVPKKQIKYLDINKEKIKLSEVKDILQNSDITGIGGSLITLAAIGVAGAETGSQKAIEHIIEAIRPMLNEICSYLDNEIESTLENK